MAPRTSDVADDAQVGVVRGPVDADAQGAGDARAAPSAAPPFPAETAGRRGSRPGTKRRRETAGRRAPARGDPKVHAGVLLRYHGEFPSLA